MQQSHLEYEDYLDFNAKTKTDSQFEDMVRYSSKSNPFHPQVAAIVIKCCITHKHPKTLSWYLTMVSDDVKYYSIQHDILLYIRLAIEKDSCSALQVLLSYSFRDLESRDLVSRDLVNYAAKYSLECLQYLYDHYRELITSRWNSRTFHKALYNDQHLDVVKWLHLHGCEWNADVCASAAGYGLLDVLTYLHTHGCPWDVRTCTKSAENGHVECLQYAHEHGCPMPLEVAKGAALEEQFKTFQYCIDVFTTKGSPNEVNATEVNALIEEIIDVLWQREAYWLELEVGVDEQEAHDNMVFAHIYSTIDFYDEALRSFLFRLWHKYLHPRYERMKITRGGCNVYKRGERGGVPMSLYRKIKSKMEKVNLYCQYAKLECGDGICADVLQNVVCRFF